MNKHPLLRLIGLSMTLGFLVGLSSWLYFMFVPVVTDAKGLRIVLHPGESVKTFASDLSHAHIISHPLLFRVILRLRGQAHHLRAGEYHFSKGTTLKQLVDDMVAGRGICYQAFTIIPGWNVARLRQEMLHNPHMTHTLQNVSDQEIMQRLGDLHAAEGQFFPDTYYFLEGAADVTILKRAYEAMQARLLTAWQTRDDVSPFPDPYTALIAASLIEKEAYLNSERIMIAGVLVNRLRKNMLLQFDPTVIYGLGSHYDGHIHKMDLRSRSPFNTYIHKGLPPTPIAMVSLASLHAVLHPAQHDYLYFVARGDGSHQFSKTLQAHNRAVKEAILRQTSQPFFNSALVGHYFVRTYHE